MVAHQRGISFSVLALIFVAGLIVGGMVSALVLYRQISALNDELSNVENQVSSISGNQNIYIQNGTVYENGTTAFSELYDRVKDSVVLISGALTGGGGVQGSGFIYNFTGSLVVVTNNHVVHGTTNVSVTFSDGDGYTATVKGTDPYSDLAVLSVSGPSQAEFRPLEIVDSSSLKVGNPVVAIGNPYGLTGSMTTGIVSALGRTIQEDLAGNFLIANIIQTSAPINPGNSGGPLLNWDGKVVGITTAIVVNSQGLGFAVPSNTILKEVYGLVEFGKYDAHSYLGVEGGDMDYDTAQSMHASVTYGWLVGSVVQGGPAANAKAANGTAMPVRVNDIIIGINGTRVRSGDEMRSWVEANTMPTQTVILTVARGNQTLSLWLTLGKRPPPPA